MHGQGGGSSVSDPRKGVFATAAFDRGETILGIDDSRTVDEVHPPDEAAGEFEHHCDWLGDRTVLMQEPERYINHSCEPSACIVTVEVQKLAERFAEDTSSP
jgi:SET domain